MTWIPVAELEDLQARGRICLKQDGYAVLLIWHLEQVFAVENRCSHAFKPLEQGKIINHTIQCPYHGALFDLHNGEHLAPPAFKGIRTFVTRITRGRIEIAF